jgi:thiamine-monophosphate kinase
MRSLEDFGERAAVEALRKILDREGTPVGLGDDCGVLDLNEDDYLLLTTDLIARRTHMHPAMSPEDIGWHLVAINLSDIAAMGGRPLGFVAAFAAPKDTDLAFLERVSRGMDSLCREHGIHVLGGDTKEAEEMVLTGTAVGVVPKTEILLRSGCRPGDVVAVTGALGRAGCGFHALGRDLELPSAVAALTRPTPRVAEGIGLSKCGAATAMMDVSDGLSASLHQMMEASGFGFEIVWEEVPVAEEVTRFPDLDPTFLPLHYGGDYELLVTLKPDGFRTAEERLSPLGTPLTAMGTVVEERAVRLSVEGRSELLEDRGYEHFRHRR